MNIFATRAKPYPTIPPSKRSLFVEQSNYLKGLGRPRLVFASVRSAYNGSAESKNRFTSHTYVKPKVEGEIKGKLNIKAAKRARVRAMKAAQNEVNHAIYRPIY